MHNMSLLSAISRLVLSVFLATLTPYSPAHQVTAFAINANALESRAASQTPPTTSTLASKVIYQSPSVAANVYKEFIVASKPLNLRKYSSALKTKKTKKDSKIYYIPIPPMPYRYIPGKGYDYQPMRINPILMEAQPQTVMPAPTTTTPVPQHHHHPQQFKYPAVNKRIDDAGESQMIRMQRGDYYFNGRPFRLQVAHAHPKHRLTPLNLKSKFYFNKNFIFA